MKYFICFVACSVLFVGSISAQTWDGSSSSDWNTAANWSTNAVPTTAGTVTIPGAGVTNWPEMPSNLTIGRLVMQSGSQLNTNGFSFIFTSTGGVSFTGATVTNPVAGNTTNFNIPGGGTSINGCTFNGNFSFDKISPNQTFNEANTAANTWNGNTTFNILAGESLSMCNGFPSTFNGNLTINKPADITDNALANLFFEGAFISGDFTLNYDDEARLWLGNTGKTVRVGGRIFMNINNVASSLQIYGLKNNTPGGNIVINNVDVGLNIEEDSLLVNTLDITQTASSATIDSCYIKADFSFNATTTNGTQSLNLINSTFDGDASFTSLFSDINEGSLKKCTYLGNASFNTTSGRIALGFSDTSTFHKNVTINSTADAVISGLKFAGNTNSELTQTGTQPLIIGRIIMEKTGGARLTLNDSVAITTSVRFTSGNIYTSSANYLRFNNNVGYTGASAASHVVGPVQKLGLMPSSAAFTFPLGSGTTYNPVTKSNSSTAADLFSAEYISGSPSAVGDTSLKAPSIRRISGCEYWNVQRLNGSVNVTLLFNYGNPCSDNGPVYITDPSKINIARWNGLIWEDLGNGGSTGTTSGTILAAAPVVNYGFFAFGSTDVIANPLPLSLLSFTANKSGKNIQLNWRTENERNTSFFVVEKSSDARDFSAIKNVGARNTPSVHSYAVTDESPFEGNNFYRLKNVDRDGRFDYSDIIKIDFSKQPIITLAPNPVMDVLLIKGAAAYNHVQVIGADGRLLIRSQIISDNQTIQIGSLMPGTYVLRLSGIHGSKTIPFIKR